MFEKFLTIFQLALGQNSTANKKTTLQLEKIPQSLPQNQLIDSKKAEPSRAG